MLKKEDWKYDLVPEILDGKNIGDYVDKDILEKLDQLEREEEMVIQAQLDEEQISEEELDEDLLMAYKDIK